MKKIFSITIIFFSCLGFSQKPIAKVLKELNRNSVPYISAEALSQLKNPTILDAREKAEFEISHIKNAFFVGFDQFNLEKTTKILTDKNQKIVVYCSLGVRSERIGEKLLKAGYTNVYNLYGGIFDWKNQNFSVVDSNNIETQNVHAFSKEWSKYLKKGNKIY